MNNPDFPKILYEDNHLLIVNKRVGDLVQGDETQDIPLVDLLKVYLKEKYNKPGNVFLGVIHRLDRPVSGVVAFAKTSKALSRMNEAFRLKTTKKTYLAIVKNIPIPNSGTLQHYMRRDRVKNKSFCYPKEVPGSKLAILDYTLVSSINKYHIVEIYLHTGRHHQIRAQLSKAGFPVKGDLKYGFPRSEPDGGIALHAYKLCFTHPVNKTEIEVVAPVPDRSLWGEFGCGKQ
jgi:23S rRNA pseudouridine1911/1915/1917 synthase